MAGKTAERLRHRLQRGPPLLLDGATGTELERRGVTSRLPLWSTWALLDAQEHVYAIHASYVAAGAEIVTANTFRTQRRTLQRSGLGERCFELTAQAVSLARRAADEAGHPVWVAGSAPTLEDCYHPELAPDEDTAGREQTEHIEALSRAGVDLIAIETMNTIREARAAAQAAAASGLPFYVSFVSWENARLLSGETLRDALTAIAPTGPLAVLVNCLPPSAVRACLPELQIATTPFGVYSNLGGPLPGSGGLRDEDCSPQEFAAIASGWVDAGARIVGGCCGTTPEHIAAIADSLAKRR